MKIVIQTLKDSALEWGKEEIPKTGLRKSL